MNISKFVAPNTVFDTSAAFLRNVTFDSSVYLQGVTHISSPGISASGTPYALVVNSIGTDVSIQAKQLGTMAFETSTNYYGKTAVDNLIADVSGALDVRLDFIDTSIGALDVLTQKLDASIGSLWSWDLAKDASIVALRAKDASQDASIGALDTLTQKHDASIGALWSWDLAKDASIVQLRTDVGDVSSRVNNLNSSLGLFVLKAGDTMTGQLLITGGGLQVGVDISDPEDVSIFGTLYVNNDTYIKGDLTVDGSLYVVNVESIDVSAAYVHLNTGLVGAPPPTLQSGIVINRGSADPYVFVYDESLQQFRIGIATLSGASYIDSSTQAVATRQDVPIANGIAYWNSTANRFDTSVGFTIQYAQGKFADLDASIVFLKSWELAQDASIVQLRTDISDVSTRLSLFSVTDLSTRIYDAEVSINRLDGSVNFLFDWDLAKDASIVALRAKDASQDASIGALDVLTQIHDASIGALWSWDLSQDASIVRIDASLNDVIDIATILDASFNQVYSDISEVSTRVSNLETSVGALDVLTQILDSSVGALWSWDLAKDASIEQLRTDIGDVSTRLSDFGVSDLSTRIYDAETSINRLDGSVNYLFDWDLAKDISIGLLETDLADVSTRVFQVETSLNDVIDIYAILDASLNVIIGDISNLETSVGNLDVLTQIHDASIGALWSWDLAKDASIEQLRTDIGDVSTRLADLSVADLSTRIYNSETSINTLDGSVNYLFDWDLAKDISIGALEISVSDLSTNKLDGVANIDVPANASIYSYELDNVAYLKKIVAGSGATITEDTSTITIAVSGASGFVSKYTNTFDGTLSASIGILEVTHGLGVGPLSVAVYEGTQQVYADVDCDAAGNIVITWAPGSLGASCKYVIMG